VAACCQRSGHECAGDGATAGRRVGRGNGAGRGAIAGLRAAGRRPRLSGTWGLLLELLAGKKVEISSPARTERRPARLVGSGQRLHIT